MPISWPGGSVNLLGFMKLIFWLGGLMCCAVEIELNFFGRPIDVLNSKELIFWVDRLMRWVRHN